MENNEFLNIIRELDLAMEEELSDEDRCNNCGDHRTSLGFTVDGNCAICSYHIAMYESHKKYGTS